MYGYAFLKPLWGFKMLPPYRHERGVAVIVADGLHYFSSLAHIFAALRSSVQSLPKTCVTTRILPQPHYVYCSANLYCVALESAKNIMYKPIVISLLNKTNHHHHYLLIIMSTILYIIFLAEQYKRFCTDKI
jgi:hypothetical protein